MIEFTCCFSGHRPQAFPWGYNEEDPRCVNLKHRLKGEILCAIHDHDIHYFFMVRPVELEAPYNTPRPVEKRSIPSRRNFMRCCTAQSPRT